MERTVEAVAAALEGMTSALRVDGYDLQIVDVGQSLALRINALEDACADCLAPPSLMAGIISGALGGAYSVSDIKIQYPEGSAAAAH